MNKQPGLTAKPPQSDVACVKEDKGFFLVAVPDNLASPDLPPRRYPSSVEFLQDKNGTMFMKTEVLISMRGLAKQIHNKDITFMPETLIEDMYDEALECTYPGYLEGDWEYTDE